MFVRQKGMSLRSEQALTNWIEAMFVLQGSSEPTPRSMLRGALLRPESRRRVDKISTTQLVLQWD